MGSSNTGLVGTIGVALLNPDGTVHTARATTGVYEMGGGCYGKVITFPDAWTGSILWDTGGGSPAYATEDYEMEGMLQGVQERTDNLPDDPADQSQVEVAIATRAPASEYDAELLAIQTDLDTPDQYKADVSNLDVAVSTRAPAGEYDVPMGYLPADLGDVPTDAELDAAHGAGSWETGGGGSDWGATEREQIRDALGIDGAKTKSVGGMMQKLKKIVEAILSCVS